MKRYLALDVGDATVGVAVSDLLGLTAQGVETIRRKDLAKDIGRLQELMEQYGTKSLVVGLPRNMNGTQGERCDAVRAFAEEIRKAVPDAGIEFWDERLSTVAASRSLLEADLSRRKRRKVIDKMAAVFILQGYLDRLSMARKAGQGSVSDEIRGE
jgi:putative Holliday junction resolvase